MVGPVRHQTARFRIGVVGVCLQTPLRALLKRYRCLYSPFQTDQPNEREIHVTVVPRRTAPWKRTRYEVTVNGRLQFEPCRAKAILPYVEWAINWEVPRVMPEYLQLHASSMQVNSQGVIFPGESGSGKSTLTVGLLSRGWRYLCDEFALIHADTLTLHPYPRAICIKKPSFPVVESLGFHLDRKRKSDIKGGKGRVTFISPVDYGDECVGQPCSIRFVIFPTYTAGAQPSLKPISRAEAAFALHKVCFNLMGCRRLGLDVLAAMIRRASCYRLISSQIDATCDLIQRAIEEKSECPPAKGESGRSVKPDPPLTVLHSPLAI